MVPNAMEFTTMTLPLYPGTKIMLWHADSSQNDVETQLGEVLSNPNEPNVFGIKNLTQISWKINLPNGSQKPLAPGAIVPIKTDFIIECTNNPKDAGKII
jgi:hypothetical protein